MAEFNNIISGLGNLGATWAGAYFNVPKAQSNAPYKNKAAQVGNTQFQSSDIDGLMAQWSSLPNLPTLTGRDLYNPSTGELFASSLGAGMSSYSAASDLTSNLKGKMGTTYMNGSSGFNTATNKGWGSIGEGITFDENMTDEQMQEQLKNKFNISACGGHLHAGGGVMFDNGNALSTALNLASAGIGIGLNYAGVRNQQRIANTEAIEYNADRAYAQQLNQHNFNNAVIDTKDNMFNTQALQMMANGGDLNTNGTEFPLKGNFNYIGNGGSHESNPQQGVPQGVASDGQKNLVEEGEVVWNNYVFSRRLTVPEKFRKQYKLKDGISFADAAQKLTGEAKERPNDPISQNGMEEVLNALQAEQEDVRAKKQAREIQKALKSMSPEELMQLGAMMQQSQAQSQAQMVPEQYINPEELQGMIAACGGKLHANGGHLYADAGELDRVNKILAQYGNDEEGYKKLTEIAKLAMGNKYQGSAYTSTNFTNLINDIIDNLTGNKYESLKDLQKRTVARERLQDRDSLWQSKSSSNNTKWTDLFKRMGAYRESKKSGNAPYKYNADPNFSLNGLNVGELENSNDYKAFKQYVLDHPDDENVLRYLKMLDEGISTEQGTPLLFDEQDKLKDNWKDLFRDRSFDQIGGIYHFFTKPENKSWRERDIYRVNGQEVQMTPEEVSAFMKPAGTSVEYGDNGDITTYHDFNTIDYDADSTSIPEEDNANKVLPTGLRYAPVLGSLIGAIQSLTERPKDYSTNVTPYMPTYRPIGDYLAYNPIDTQRYLNANAQQFEAQRNAITNQSGANRNTAMAQMALANQQEQEAMANILNTAEAMNFARRAQVGEFNRGTNQFNAQAFNALQPQIAQRDQLILNQAQRNAATRMAVDQALDEAKGQNLTNLFNNLGAIGQENQAFNMANSNKALNYLMNLNGESSYKKCGGMLTKKNRRK